MLLLYFSLHNQKYHIAATRFIFFVSIALVVLSGLRHKGVGNDTYAYMMIYDNLRDITWSEVFEDFIRRFVAPMGNDEKDPGMLILIKILHFLQLDSRAYLFVVSSMVMIPLGRFVYNNSKKLETVLFTYFFYVSLFYAYLPNSAIRQSVAFSFVLWAYLLFQKNNLYLGILVIVIGALFHKSSLISLVIIPLLYVRNVKFWYIMSLLPFLFFLIFQETAVNFLVDGNEIYSGYGTGGYYTGNNQGKPFLVILLISAFFYLGWISCSKLEKTEMGIKTNLLIFGCALTFVLIPVVWVNPTALRIISYFAPCMAIIVGAVFSRIKWGRILFLFLLIVFLYKSISSMDNYRFMWQKMELHERYAEVIDVRKVYNNFIIT